MSVELLVDVWHDIKGFIAPKDRIDVAHVLVAKFDEYGMTDGIENTVVGFDKSLKEAVASFYHLDEEEVEYEEYGNEHDDD